MCCDPNQLTIQWEARNRNGLLHYIVSSLNKPFALHIVPQKVAGMKYSSRKVALYLYLAVPSILRLEMANSDFARAFTSRLGLDLIMKQDSLRSRDDTLQHQDFQVSCGG